MIIHVLVNDGSPIGVTMSDLWGEGARGIGVGGSEYAMLTMCELWQQAGHEVILYNSPLPPGKSSFAQLPNYAYNVNDKRDVLITFRSPSSKAVRTTGCLKVWWSCDQYTVGNFAEFAKYANKIVCISTFHASFFRDFYNICDVEVIDLPVRIQDLEAAGKVEKMPKKVIFTSVPERGLQVLRGMWDEIKERVPGVNLTITSDYRLWGAEERNFHHRMAWQGVENVRFLGAIPRKQLIIEQLESQVFAYPNIYDELFCISVAEAQCSGVYPVTSGVGALSTTNMGKIVAGDPRHSDEFRQGFVNVLTDLLSGDIKELQKKQRQVQKAATVRFDPKNIMKQWDERIFKCV